MEQRGAALALVMGPELGPKDVDPYPPARSFTSKQQAAFNFTIHSDFGAQENKICHCLHFFLISVQFSSVAQSCPTL